MLIPISDRVIHEMRFFFLDKHCDRKEVTKEKPIENVKQWS